MDGSLLWMGWLGAGNHFSPRRCIRSYRVGRLTPSRSAALTMLPLTRPSAAMMARRSVSSRRLRRSRAARELVGRRVGPDLLERDLVAVGHDRALDAVLQFTDVARPGCASIARNGLFAQAHRTAVLLLGEAAHEGMRQQGGIAHPVTQGGMLTTISASR